MKAPKLVLLTAAVFMSLASYSQTDSTKTDTTGTQTDSTAKDSTQVNLQAGVSIQSNNFVTSSPLSTTGTNEQTLPVADFRRYYLLPKNKA